jgi:hypothetical protein
MVKGWNNDAYSQLLEVVNVWDPIVTMSCHFALESSLPAFSLLPLLWHLLCGAAITYCCKHLLNINGGCRVSQLSWWMQIYIESWKLAHKFSSQSLDRVHADQITCHTLHMLKSYNKMMWKRVEENCFWSEISSDTTSTIIMEEEPECKNVVKKWLGTHTTNSPKNILNCHPVQIFYYLAWYIWKIK